MRIIRATSVAEVTETLASGRDLRSGSAPWTLRFLAHADTQFDGRWTEIEVSGVDALAIVLPAHAGELCRGDRLTLLPTGGGTVHEAARALTRIESAYARDNPSCWSRLMQASAAALSPVILTTAPLTLPEYADVAVTSGPLVHLDGFHRLVSWAWAGRLTKDTRVRATVAGLR